MFRLPFFKYISYLLFLNSCIKIYVSGTIVRHRLSRLQLRGQGQAVRIRVGEVGGRGRGEVVVGGQ